MQLMAKVQQMHILIVPSDHRQGLSIYTRSNLQPLAASYLVVKASEQELNYWNCH